MADTSKGSLHWFIAVVILLASLVLYRSWNTDDNFGIPLVETDCGTVLGEKDPSHKAYVFKGIPFAIPPTGERRWESPRRMTRNEATCWKGVYQGINFADQCPQLDPATKQYTGNEDCLYLNIYTPDLGKKARKPVMVYIHGGYMHFCNGSMRGYAPNPWVTEHLDVVFVSIQHRLNALGFLVLDELGKGSNYGILDIIESLRWVQRNIQGFGGDPNHVTVFGQSAGGTFVHSLLGSPLCHGLFHRAWIISGSSKMQTTWEKANRQNRFMIEKTGCKTKECFQSLSAKQIVESVYPEWTYDHEMGLPVKGVHTAALVVVDGYILRDSPMNTWQKGGVHLVDMPVIVGTTADETDFDWWNIGGHEMGKWSKEEVHAFVASKLDSFGTEITKKCLELYPFQDNARLTLNRIITDVRATCGNHLMTEKAADSLKSGVFRYYVTSKPSRPVYAFGLPFSCEYSFHGWDIFAFFEELPYWMKGDKPSDTDLKFMKTLQENIMHFVHHGKPKDVEWTEYPRTALLSDTLSYADYHLNDQCSFWLSNGFFNYTWVT